jgi:ribonucleotide reductase alpha subunit
MFSTLYEPTGFALDIFQKRYTLHEKETWLDACCRLAEHVAYAEEGDNIPLYRKTFKDFLCANTFMPAGRIWYGAGRPKGQLSNCFGIPTVDSREGWGTTAYDMIVIAGTGGGVGLNGSPIRPRGTFINGSGGKATGAVSLFEILNSAGEVIKAGGGRRTALMFSLNHDHGDIEEFLDKKLDLKQLNNANVSMNFATDPEAFFEKVRKDEQLNLVFNGRTINTLSAKALWKKVILNALKCGEPGILNSYLANKMSNVSYLYPLITTNPCVTGDTLIATADGRNAVSIKQLSDECKDVPVYSTNLETGKVEIKMGRHPRITGVKKEVWKLTLDDGSVVRATPDHKILLRNLEYRELQSLKENDSIFPFNSFDSNSYRQICNSGEIQGNFRRNRRQYRLIHEFNSVPVDAKEFAIHHVNCDCTDDRFENLKVMSHEEHRELHAKNMRGKLNPYHRMSDELKFKWRFVSSSHPGMSNPRYSNFTNEQILDEGRKLFIENGRISKSLWSKRAKECGMPIFLSNEFRFGSWTNFKNQVSQNHKVLKVEFDCYEDVYNITVDDNHNYHVVTSKQDEKAIVSSGICVKNCGEVWGPAYFSCCLGSLVLPRFVKNSGDKFHIDWKLIDSTVDLAVRFLDDIITVNNHPLPEIKEVSLGERRIGMGVMGLSSLLLLLGMKYGSDEALEFTDKLMEHVKNRAYEASVKLAEEKGPFQKFDADQFLKGGFVKTLKPSIRSSIGKHGIRNCAILTTAPTGTTSIVCDVDSAIEPSFGPGWTRKFRVGDELKSETIIHPLFKKFVREGRDVSHFQSAHELSMRNHFDMQRVCQRHVDNAISKTVNVPQGTSESELSNLVMEYLPDVKGLTVYPEGSREEQPITPMSLEEAMKHIDSESAGALSNDNCRNGVCDLPQKAVL